MKKFVYKLVVALLLIAVPLMAIAHGISEADKQSMLSGGYVRYIGLGASHMLTGYDHLLFLFGVSSVPTFFRVERAVEAQIPNVCRGRLV